MHKLIIYPLGNAETMLINLENGRRILLDYANKRDPNNKYDLRCDLPKLLKDDLNAANRDYYDAVAFTHLDDDHVHGAGEFFWLQHAQKYQGDGRIKINELWVPAAAIVETGSEDDARIIRQEARHRLRNGGSGIRVFSAPDTLKGWFEDEGLDIDDYRKRNIILDAGRLVPTFTLASDSVEFFIHSPFASRTADGMLMERNKDAIVMQATFQSGSQKTKFLITSDIDCTVIDEIVNVTKFHKREERLAWDILDIPHHCSWTAIGPEQGKDKTTPTENVKWLHEQGQDAGKLVSSSKPIPSDDSDTQPPHRQAAAYYEDVKSDIDGEFLVTMEYPKKTAPEPIVIEISNLGAAIKRTPIAQVGSAAVGSAAPRMG